MKLVTARYNGQLVPGKVVDQEVLLFEGSSIRSLLAAPEGLEAATAVSSASLGLEEVNLAPVVPDPDKIVCVGVNYLDHILEMGREKPPAPTYFAKFRSALIGATDDIELPDQAQTTNVDWECELAVVIGARTRNVGASEALGSIAGFTILNDVSVRDWQRRTSQFLAGKTFEALTPVGPWLVTTDEIGDGSSLDLRTLINGEIKQQSNTSNLVFSALDIVADLSRIITLEPGDIIATGTPGGVGAARNPPEFLAPGDEMITEVDGIGRLHNRCV